MAARPIATPTPRGLTRRFAARGLAAPAVPTALALGCGPGGAGAPAAPAARPVTLVYLGLESPGFLQRDAVRDFTRRYPHVTVDETYTAGGAHMEKVQAQAAAGTPADAYWQSTGWATTLGAGGVSAALDDRMKNDRDFDHRDWAPAPGVDTGNSFKGKVYGLIAGADPCVVYYNKAVFDRLGRPYPTKGWSWDDYLTAVRALTRRSGGTVELWGASVDRSYWTIYPWVWQNGGSDYSQDASELVLHQAAALQALQWRADLIWRHAVAPKPGELEGSAVQHFVDGRIATLYNHPLHIADLRKFPEFTSWDIVNPPQGRNTRDYNNIYAASYGMATEGKNQDAAWTLLKSFVSKEHQLAVWQFGGWPPSRRSAGQDPAFLKAGGVPANAQAFADEMAHLRNLSMNPKWSQANGVVNNEILKAIFADGRPATEVVPELKPKVDAILQEGLR
jgi:multiple sugar transport system substrate-binding protein